MQTCSRIGGGRGRARAATAKFIATEIAADHRPRRERRAGPSLANDRDARVVTLPIAPSENDPARYDTYR